MKAVSKILIAYDGSACADAALNDLKRAGLPAALEAVVLTVADVILPPPSDEVPEEELLIHTPAGIRHAQEHAEQAVKDARALAERAAGRVKASFPGWEVKAEARGDSPAWGLIKLADSLKADLVVVGSHGHTVAGGRLILGSVSQRVLYEARCSVRVARCVEAGRVGPYRIVIGFNGSPDSERAVEAVAARAWPEGSEARIVTALAPEAQVAPDAAADKMRAAGLSTSNVVRGGNPSHVLVEEAEGWGADAVFVGTRDLHGFKHFLTGSVSSAVAARAHCSVEVVRGDSTS
ncbi:MAG TPA: universal stress protein [Pyrinomonadaceae bacterium]|nr:universal stress protein [Pyrinomonadaceae bacterium]